MTYLSSETKGYLPLSEVSTIANLSKAMAKVVPSFSLVPTNRPDLSGPLYLYLRLSLLISLLKSFSESLDPKIARIPHIK